MVCPLYFAAEESDMHMFFNCIISFLVWKKLDVWFGMEEVKVTTSAYMHIRLFRSRLKG